ncbi:MAG: SUMF1/EgtB/PvdO family nonheme iron enzyme [Reichenbachiella sp.]|uniref:SUMF1/EgtB/PvdO family nonheme iron enzyme n=1 Tax=Reichenbachiella sp. TaxID=2184521 RepID=UPI0032674CE4
MKNLIIVAILVCVHTLNANNVDVSAVSTQGQDVSAGVNNAANFANVEFDLNWDNSWRVSTGPSNWDAVWVFIKYKIEGGTGCTAGDWQHATLSTNNAHHSVQTDNGVTPAFSASSDGMGVFLYRNANGNGSINWDQVRLRWNYGSDGLLDACEVTVKVFAVEMVYVPQSNFFLGSGGTEPGEFEDGVSGNPLLITSDGTLTLGGGGAGSLGNHNATGQSGGVDDFNDASSQTLPAAFPLGYDAFYCMKYEITNQQYAEFLNTLTAAQQAVRASTTTAGNFHENSATPVARAGLKCQIAPSGSVAGVYGCDLDDDDTYNEVGSDGLGIALSAISWPDLTGYLDWAGLRPFTETEFEKSCRGNQLPIVNEYAWGTAAIHASTYTALTNSGGESELPNSPGVGATAGNAVYSTTHSTGPLRVGIFATASSTRVIAGASYYGVMELTGNVWEDAVGLGSVAGRSYTGLHGNGSLNASGHADVDYWPGINGNNTSTNANSTYGGTTGVTGRAGAGFTGGTYNTTAWLRVANRQYSLWTGLTGRDTRNGGRGIRTAP